MQRVAQTSVTAAEAGRTVLDLLAARFTYRTREQWLALIGEGRVLRNAAPAVPDALLCENDTLEFLPPPLAEPPVNTEYRVLFEDEYLLAVDKPPNLPCHPAGRFFNHTLWALVRQRTGLESFRFVHRIDRETSGVVLMAKTALAARGCSRQIEKHQAVKRYLAIVEGAFPARIDARGWLVRDTASEVRKKRKFLTADGDRDSPPAMATVSNGTPMLHAARPGGHAVCVQPSGCPDVTSNSEQAKACTQTGRRVTLMHDRPVCRPGDPDTAVSDLRPEWAETELRLISRHGEMSLVEALPRTGRTHQIRATLASLGYPLIGDTLYGVDDTLFLRFRTGTLTDEDRRRLRLDRQALHAASLVLRHPITGSELRIEAELPEDLRQLLERA